MVRKDLPAHNEGIRACKLRVIAITENGERNLGIIDTRDALRMSKEQDLDLVVINANTDPPIAKIMDMGKWLYQKSKDQKEKRAADRNRGGQIHELTMRPGIEEHDINVRVKKILAWTEEGDKVKIVITFRGRENQQAKELGRSLILKITTLSGTQQEGKEELSSNKMSLYLIRAKTVSKQNG